MDSSCLTPWIIVIAVVVAAVEVVEVVVTAGAAAVVGVVVTGEVVEAAVADNLKSVLYLHFVVIELYSIYFPETYYNLSDDRLYFCWLSHPFPLPDH